MAGRLNDIKETASDAVEIIRELGSPDVQQSLEKIRETAKLAKELIESMQNPAMVTNIENMRKIAESIEKTSNKMEAVTQELKNSGILQEAKETVKSAKTAIDSIGDSKSLGETVDAVKEMLRAISALVEELKLTVVASKKSGVIHNMEEAVRDTRAMLSTEYK